jgi:hypothetical protein
VSRSRRADPDYVIDADRGAAAGFAGKRAAVLSRADALDRAGVRDGARELDEAVERLPGLTRQRRDRERAMPRDLTAPSPHPRMERALPDPETIRTPLSSRQRKARSVVKRGVQDDMPQTQYDTLRRLVADPRRRAALNNAVSDAAGDVQQLSDRDRAAVQRADRAIQAYERAGNRGHVLYANLELPAAAAAGHPVGRLRASFPPGTVIAFDRFTGTAHTLHEVEPPSGGESMPVFEIQTRRGMYLGRSDSVDDTTHLLPRGLRLRVESCHEAAYRRPDGSIGRRPVIQVLDLGQA